MKKIILPPRKVAKKIGREKSAGAEPIVTRYENWAKAAAQLASIKNTTPQSNPVDWFNLQGYTEHLLFHDQMRLVESINYQIDYAVAKLAPHIHDLIINCLSDSNCQELKLTTEEQKLLSEKERYKYSWAYYLNSPAAEKRTWIGLLEYHLSADLVSLAFSPSPSVRRSAKSFTLSLDAGDFKNDKIKIEKAVAANWQNQEGLKVVIRWVQRNESDLNIYKLVRPSQAQGTAHLDEENGLIFLNSTNSPSEIAHEIGHALGFRDHYYRSWDVQRCSYKDEFDLSDLMSFPDSGSVTNNDWALLKGYYPVSPL